MRTTTRSKHFAAFILTHGRADRVHTYSTLRKSGYTGRIVVLIDNEDAQAPAYRALYGSEVEEFDKLAVARASDEGDNFNDRRAVFYARNACFEVAQRLGITRFIQLDDDYVAFRHKRDAHGNYIDGKDIKALDRVLNAMLRYFESIPATSIAMAQTGDFPGGAMCTTRNKHSRKAMNSFICSTERPFRFVGRVNEDVNTYTLLGSRGHLFLTIKDLVLQQKQTQSNEGGMTGMYLESGTYTKTFYTVMMQPSSTKVFVLPTKNPRIHHKVRWRNTVPVILSPEHRKPQPALQ